jgi:hypothetical protein
MAAKPEPARRFVKGDVLSPLSAQLAEQQRLLQAVRSNLPEFLAPHCRHCVPRGERLLIYADTPAFASHLRFYGPNLLMRLEQATGQRFRECQVRNLFSVIAEAKGKPPSPIHRPAPKVVNAIRDDAINRQDEVGEALLRLCRALDQVGPGNT